MRGVPAQAEQLARQRRGALRSVPDVLDVVAHLRIRRECFGGEIRVAQDHDEQDVEVVCDDTGQLLLDADGVRGCKRNVSIRPAGGHRGPPDLRGSSGQSPRSARSEESQAYLIATPQSETSVGMPRAKLRQAAIRWASSELRPPRMASWRWSTTSQVGAGPSRSSGSLGSRIAVYVASVSIVIP